MAYFFSGQSHTFNEYLLVPGYSSSECIPDNVSLRTPLTRFRAGEEPALSLNVPMVSAVMQSVSGDRLAVALAQEGGVSARHQRYRNNQRRLVAGMRALGFRTLLDDSLHSPIITAFYSPDAPQYRFHTFYQKLKDQGFVIYPGKVSQSDCFRIGNIGEVYDADITALLAAINNAMYWKQ